MGSVSEAMGSVAEKIFWQAPCPVLTVGPNVCGEPDVAVEMRTILYPYPTDFCSESLAAASNAISMAQEHQARLCLLRVTQSPVDKATEGSQEAELWCEPKAYVDFGSASEKILGLGEELAAISRVRCKTHAKTSGHISRRPRPLRS